MIEVENLTCRRGRRTTVDDLSFTVQRGSVTGFLGPNGAGKSTTMKMIAGMLQPSSGSARVDGRAYRDLPSPVRHLGVLLEPAAVHSQRSAVNHLRMVARTAALPRTRVDEVLEMAGLTSAANTKVGQFSLGMRQRLGIAVALLGDPGTLMLDEPVNGLDPDGIVWLRVLLRSLAAEGRAVVLSSHLISEIAVTADRVVVLGRGRKLADAALEDLQQSGTSTVTVSAAEVDRLLGLLPATARIEERVDAITARVSGVTATQVSEASLDGRIVVHALSTNEVSLEHAFQELTDGAAEHTATVGAAR